MHAPNTNRLRLQFGGRANSALPGQGQLAVVVKGRGIAAGPHAIAQVARASQLVTQAPRQRTVQLDVGSQMTWLDGPTSIWQAASASQRTWAPVPVVSMQRLRSSQSTVQLAPQEPEQVPSWGHSSLQLARPHRSASKPPQLASLQPISGGRSAGGAGRSAGARSAGAASIE